MTDNASCEYCGVFVRMKPPVAFSTWVALAFVAGQLSTNSFSSPAVGTGSSCGDSWTGRGIISSRGALPSLPALGQTCTWTVAASRPGQLLEVYFDEFSIGDNASLEIYSGGDASNASSWLTAYSGSAALGFLLLLPSTVTVVYRNSFPHPSGGLAYYFRSVTAPAKNAGSVEYECPTTVQIGSGSLTSPGWPGWYPANARCKWVLVEEARGTPLRITFVDFSLAAHDDYLRVYDGDVNGRLYAEYTGDDIPVDLIMSPSRGYITLEFHSDNTIHKSGFRALFYSETEISGSSESTERPAGSATLRTTIQYSGAIDTNDTVAVNDPFGCNHQYYFVKVPADWATAEQQCQRKFGGHLVKVDSVYEHNFLVDIIVNNTDLNGFNYWIGGYSPSYPFSWRWSCGETPLGYGSTYYVAPWGEGRGNQPDIYSELCIHLWFFLQSNIRYGWNNAYCSVSSVHSIDVYSICEVCGSGAC